MNDDTSTKSFKIGDIKYTVKEIYLQPSYETVYELYIKLEDYNQIVTFNTIEDVQLLKTQLEIIGINNILINDIQLNTDNIKKL